MKKSYLCLIVALVLLSLLLINTACSAPTPVLTAKMCTDTNTCTSFAPGTSVGTVTISWTAVTTNHLGKPLTYPVTGYEVFLIHGSSKKETKFDVKLSTQPVTFNKVAPSYTIPKIGKYGFKTGDKLCAELTAYHFVPVNNVQTKRVSPRSDRLCLVLTK